MGAPFVHIELSTDDVEKASKFYEQLFGWKIQHDPKLDYSLFDTGKEPGGGIMKRQPGTPAGWSVYVGVADAAATIETARALGAIILKERTVISPEIGAFAVLQDPTGAVICLHEAARMPAERGAEPPAATH